MPFEEWDAGKLREKLPIYDTRRYGPPRLMSDEGFGEPSGGELAGGVFWPTAGYISDPQLSTHNLQRAAEAKGSEFRFGREVVEILNDGGRIRGVKLDDGTEITSPIVVNVAGPHSAIVNGMAGALDDMTIETKPLRQEVVHVPAPAGFDFESLGTVVSDSDIGCYIRPETGNHILVGSEDPECDPREFVDPDDYVRDFTEQGTTQAHRYGQRMPTLGIPSSLRGVVDLYDASDEQTIVEETRGYPYFLQEWGKHVWDVAERSPIDSGDVARASTEVAAALDAGFFRARFDRLTPTQKRYLRAMAELGPGPHRSGEIARALDRKVTALGPTRAQLIAKGMIWSAARGDTAFTVPSFDRFMRRVMPGDEWRE